MFLPASDPSFHYEGGRRNGLPNGRGVYTDGRNNRYEGDFVAGHAEGQGVYSWGSLGVSAKLTYEGGFAADLPSGHGVLSKRGGRYYEGQFINGVLQGHCVMENQFGQRQQGTCVDGALEGEGLAADYDLPWDAQPWFWQSGVVRKVTNHYSGGFHKGLREGKGRDYDGDRLVYEGDFKAGDPEGSGIFYRRSGERFEGEWRVGKPYGAGTLITKDGTRYSGFWHNGCLRDGAMILNVFTYDDRAPLRDKVCRYLHKGGTVEDGYWNETEGGP